MVDRSSSFFVNLLFFLQQGSHLQAKKLGEDGVGECHCIWMQASVNQKNSCKGGTKLSGLFFAENLEAHPIKKAKIWSGKWKEREMCRDATWRNPKLSKCVDLRALMDSWLDWNSCMAARFFVNVYQRVARSTLLPNTEHSPENVA